MISELLKNSLPKYEMVLPTSKKTLKFRPMTVKEEKILLLAQQSMSVNLMANAMVQILKNCVDGLEKPEQLTMADAEKAFLMIRSKSMGEMANFVIKCPETKEPIPIQLNLENFEFENRKEENGKIKLSDDMLVVLKQPNLEYFLNYEEDSPDELKNLFKNCFLELQTPTNVYKKTELSMNDISEFYDYMTSKQLNLISEYMNTVPRFRKKIEYTTKDGIKREFILFGIDSFFAYASAT